MAELKKINPLSLAKIFSVLNGFAGLILGAIASGYSFLGIEPSSQIGPIGSIFGIASILIVPLIHMVMGFITGYLVGLFYNLAAKEIGGIEIELEYNPKPPVKPK